MMQLLILFATFLKIGLFTFGGGYAMIPLIEQEVSSRGWMSVTELTDFIAISESTPGPFAVNISTFIGMKTAGFFGALVATLGVVLPSFIIILLVARFFGNFQKNRYISSGLSAMRVVVIGLIASAAYSLAATVFLGERLTGGQSGSVLTQINFAGLLICLAAGFLYFKKKLHPIALIGACAALGVVVFGGAELLGWSVG